MAQENRPSHVRLELPGFRPLRRGEPGFSPTARKYLNETTGEIISVRRYQALAQRIPVEPSSSRPSSARARSSAPTPSSPTPTAPTARPQRPEPQNFGTEFSREDKFYAVMHDLERGVSLSRSLKFHHLSKSKFIEELQLHENATAIADTRFRNRPARYHVDLLKPVNARTVTVTRGKRAGQTYEINDGYTVFPEPVPTFTIVTQGNGLVQISTDYKYAGTIGKWGDIVDDIVNRNIDRSSDLAQLNPVVRDARGNVYILETDVKRLKKLFGSMTKAERRKFSEEFYLLMMLGLV